MRNAMRFPPEPSAPRLFAGLVLVGVVVAAANAGPDAPPVAATLRARRLEIVDDAGRARIALYVDAGPRLMIYDTAGRHRLALSLQGEGAPGLEVFTADGAHAVQLRQMNDESLLSLHDVEGNDRIRLLVPAKPEQAATATFRSTEGSTTLVLPTPE
jgi:hypothetical protein